MGTYTDFEWREMEADPAHDKPTPAVPTQSFDSWLDDAFEEKVCEIAAALVDRGWSEEAAMEEAYLRLEDGP
jgi:hypothetical protein